MGRHIARRSSSYTFRGDAFRLPLRPHPTPRHTHRLADRPRHLPLVSGVVGALLIASTVSLVAVGGSSGAGATTDTTSGQNVYDAFARTVSTGMGSAPVGGTWSTAGPVRTSVNAGVATAGPIQAGASGHATLADVNAAAETLSLTFSVPALPSAGGGVYIELLLREKSVGTAYLAKLRVWPNGLVTLGASRTNNAKETRLEGSATLSKRLQAGQRMTFDATISGSTLQLRAYPTGSQPSSWMLATTDSSSAAIAGSGHVGLGWYSSSNTSASSVRMYQLVGSPFGVGQTPPPVRPGSSPVSSTPPQTSTPAPPSTSTSDTPSPSSPASSTTPTPPASAGVGAAPVGSMVYPLPSNAIYVSPSGSDAGPGDLAHPYRTVAAAVAAAHSGQTIVLRAGSYDESVAVPGSKTLTIQNYPNEAAWLDGSTSVSGWSAVSTGSGSAWVHTGWTPQFDSTAGYTASIAANTAPNWTWLNPAYPMAAHPDQVWVDGSALSQVGSLSQVGPGTFYVDYGTQRLYVGSDPSGHSVRASDTAQALVVDSPNTVIRGIGIRRYATSVPLMGTVVLRGVGDAISNVQISDNATQGIYLRATGITVDHLTAQGNGLLGVLATYADGMTVTNSLITGNNTQHFNFSPVAGGMKITRTRGITVRDSSVSDNIGNGLWLDESSYNAVIAGNTLADNLGRGFTAELSALGVVVDNTVTGNGQEGIRLSDTSNYQIWNNTLAGNARGVEIYQDTRQNTPSTPGHDPRQPDPDPTISWVTDNVQVMNNLFLPGGQYHVFVADGSGARTASQMGVTLNGNYYARPTQSGYSEVGWGVNGVQVTGYNSPAAFTAATGQGQQNTDGPAGANGLSPQAAAAAAAPAGNPLPLPAGVASAAGEPTGTRHLGTF